MIRVEYKIVTGGVDSITFDIRNMNFDALLINNQGLYYLFHPNQVLNILGSPTLGEGRFVRLDLHDATQIPSEVAKMLTGE